jgi:hypothetical protein
MREPARQALHLELREYVVEASRALAALDADRLEELALSCQTLNRELPPGNSPERADFARQAREAQREVAVFARVLGVTRANLAVIHRLRDLRRGRLEYGDMQGNGWAGKGNAHGNN